MAEPPIAPDPADHLIIVSLPKSATVFIQRSVEATLHAKHCRIYPRGARGEIEPSALRAFLAEPVAMAGDHAPPSLHNLRILVENGLNRIALVVRDPRDALVSWWHHLDRSDQRTDPPPAADRFSLAGLRSPNYYAMNPDDRMADLIEQMFPAMQEWLANWVKAMETRPELRFHVLRYEDFVLDQANHLQGLYRFFGHDVPAIVPAKEGPAEQMSGGIHTHTHFRRGVVGSHKDEIPSRLLPLLERQIIPEVFAKFGWRL